MNQILKVALIGRANVGKSTLFNTLTEEKKALVSNIAGTTRDRNYASINWRGIDFQIIDTGGIEFSHWFAGPVVHPQDIEKDILKQADFALKEANLILFLVDVKDGVMPQDKEVALILKKSRKPVILVINKADNKRQRDSVFEFYKLNMGEPVPVSAINGSGTGDLLDKVVESIKKQNKSGQRTANRELRTPGLAPQSGAGAIRIAIIGKPNTGKSTLVNSILGEERVITSAQPYTTRDSQNIDLIYQGQPYTLIDTAGIRKTAKIHNRLEKISVDQALKSIKKADIALLMTDVSEPLTRQDKILADEILKSHASLIIVANKWDLIGNKDSTTINKFTKYYYRFFPFLSFAPVIFVSAMEKQRVKKVLELAKEVHQERYREISENALDKFLKKIIKHQPPAKGKGTKHPKIHQLKQLGVNPPEFEIIKDFNSDLHDSYLKFIENQLRQKFGFKGTPVIIKVRRLKG